MYFLNPPPLTSRSRHLLHHGPGVALFLGIVGLPLSGGCSSQSADLPGDADADVSQGNGEGDAAPALNGTLEFSINGRSLLADSIFIEESSGFYTITGSREEGNGIDFESVILQYAASSTGSDACGSVVALPDRTVVYGKYFRTNGQIATKEQYLSGLPGQPNCTFDISSHDPESGSVIGPLSSSAILTGGAGDPPVNASISWSEIRR